MQHIPVRQMPGSSKEPDLSGSFSIRNLTELLAGRQMIQELHRHDFFFILVLEKGSGRHEIDFQPYEISDYCVFLMRPGQVHQLSLGEDSSGYLIHFTPEFLYSDDQKQQSLLRSAGNKNFCRPSAERFGRIDAILASVLAEYTTRQEGYREVIKSSLNIFFIELLRHCQGLEIKRSESDLYQQEKLEKFTELLEKDSNAHKQVAHYADALHLSPYQLAAISKKLLGKTPSELINAQLILEARRQLLATSNQVNQIAYHLGYEDVSYFIRFFKKHTGHSPEAFRHNFK